MTTEIGFFQLHDSVLEGEDVGIVIRLQPDVISENITGQVIPLTIEHFISYMNDVGRSIPTEVQMAINDITDPAESKILSLSLEKVHNYSPSLHVCR